MNGSLFLDDSRAKTNPLQTPARTKVGLKRFLIVRCGIPAGGPTGGHLTGGTSENRVFAVNFHTTNHFWVLLLLIRNMQGTPTPHMQGKLMNKNLTKSKLLKKKQGEIDRCVPPML